MICNLVKSWAALALVFVICSPVWAIPPNSGNIDGRIIEYNASDWSTNYVIAMDGAAEPWTPNNLITNIYITWDEDFVYFAVRGWVAFPSNPGDVPNKIAMLIDVDPGVGTGATTTTNWLSGDGFILYNALGWTGAGDTNDFGFDYMVASEGNSHNFIRITYDDAAFDTNLIENVYDNFNNIFPPDVTIGANLQRVNDTYLHNGFEAKIPWSTLYPTNDTRFGEVLAGELVPRGASFKVFANLHNNRPSTDVFGIYSSPMVIPEQGGAATYADGFLVTDSYFEVLVDQDNDGMPDMGNAADNPPYLTAAIGHEGQDKVYVYFNEDIDPTEATNTLRWRVSGTNVLAAELLDGNLVELSLAGTLPGNGTWVRVDAENIPDLDGAFQESFQFLNPSNAGLTNAIQVTFVLETDSGMGDSPGASNFFVNGSAFPLEWGFPPAKNNQLAQQSGTLYSRTINFLPGSSTQIFYKYSAEMSGGDGRGTNNYEGIRLANHTDAYRILNISDDLSSLVVTDYLGAAAAPWRDSVYTNGYEDFYYDTRRGDAGVRENKQVLFTVDLSARSLKGARVVLVGTDPLRGFNDNPDFAFDNGQHWYDNPDLTTDVTWDNGGLTMYDDGTNGDAVAGDGTYSRLCFFTTTGKLDEQSLVGEDEPYWASWTDRRSPRSFDYKFVVYRPNSDDPVLYSPSGDNLTHYLPDSITNIVMDTHVWANDDLPFPDAESDPELINIAVSNNVPYIEFINEPTEFQHGVQVALDLNEGFRDHGLRGVFTNGIWTASVPGPADDLLFYRAYAGPAPERSATWWTPNPVSATGATVQVWFSQINRETRGQTQVYLRSPLMTNGVIDYSGDWISRPMTFVSNGLWTIDLEVAPLPEGVTKDSIQFGFTENPGSFGGLWDVNWWPSGSEPYRIIVGSRASWTPERPAAGGELTITYDATGGVLEGQTNVWIYSGFNKFEGTEWTDAYQSAMTNVEGEVWTTTVVMPTNGFKTLNMLFRDLSDTNAIIWDNEYDQINWVVFPENVE
jgi:hypothetical protein